ncbi:MAG TPA: hypothetical protein VI259_09930, partial [Gemmatimonadaceae bacterium]
KSQDGKSDCLIRIDPAIDSHSLNPNPAGKTAWYPIARIVNTTDNCVPLALSIGKTDTALWIAKFGGGKHDGEVSIGDAGVVVIAHPGSGHDSWSIGDRWSFKQCGHPGSHNSDDAMIWIGPGLCPHLEKDGHNPALVAQDLSQMLSARTSKGAWDPNPWYPDLWFACGGDCCYSDLGK